MPKILQKLNSIHMPNRKHLHVAHTSQVSGLGRSVFQQQKNPACFELQSKRAGSVSSYVAFSLVVHTNFIVELRFILYYDVRKMCNMAYLTFTARTKKRFLLKTNESIHNALT